MRKDGHAIPAQDLSQGTLFALAILTLAHIPEPRPIVCFEEPDRGIHPRLLREVRDALYRLSYPGKFGEDRAPVQVIATTHSPYFLDLLEPTGRQEAPHQSRRVEVGSPHRILGAVTEPCQGSPIPAIPLQRAHETAVITPAGTSGSDQARRNLKLQ